MSYLSCIQKPDEQKYAVVIPSLCEQSNKICLSSLIKCKFCKAYNIPPQQKNNSLKCQICQCFTDIPTNFQYPDIPPQSQSFVAYEQNDNPDLLRILLVYHVDQSDQMVNGLLCLSDILPKLGKNIQVGCLLYDENVRVVDLNPDGEMIRVNYTSLEVLQEKFAPISAPVLDRLITVLTESKSSKSLVNGSKIISEIIPILKKKTIILWVGNFKEDTAYIPHLKSPFIEVYSFLKVPPNVGNLSFSKQITQMAKNCAKVKLILKNQPQLIAQQLHYELYDIFDNFGVRNIWVQSSRQKKYPPEIITPFRQRSIGCLRDAVIVKLGKQTLKNQKIQIRIHYTTILDQNPFEKYGKNDGQSHYRQIFCFNFTFDDEKNSSEQHDKLITLFTTMSGNQTRKQIQQYVPGDQNQADVYHFLRQSSFLQKFQLNQCLCNPNCIFIVWPWIGFVNKSPKFVFYFKGYFCKLQVNEELNQMFELCQINYTKKQRILPIYYHSMIEDIEEEFMNYYQQEDQEYPQQMQNQGNRYYSFEIQGMKK